MDEVVQLNIEETIAKYEKYVNPTLAKLLQFMGLGTVEARAEGVYIWDVEGNRYLDCLGNFGVFALGHCHPKVVEAVQRQAALLPQTARYFLDKPMADLAALLGELTPGELQYSFFGNSGAEAVEGALKLARLATGKPGVIYTQNGFHGKTLGALSATGRDLFRQPCEPLLPHFKMIPFGEIQALEEAIDPQTAAFIVEPIQGEGGVNVPPAEYLPAVREICNQRGVVLIFDEVQTGLGRTGKLFAAEHSGVAPDIMTLAKALGGGVMPIGAFVARPGLWEPFLENPWIHSSTFGGNPLACVAGVATIEVIQEEGLVDAAARKGERFKREIAKLQQSYPEVIKEVRGQGLLIGMEMTREGAGGYLINELLLKRIIAGFGLNNPKVIRMVPPLIITDEEIDFVLDVLGEAVAGAARVVEDL